MTEFVEGTNVAGRFVILDRIGEGGMGAVYRALQTSLDREVALKVLHSKVAFTPRARRRFGREARAVARLNHPHIAGVFDFGTDNDDQTLWLAMELVDGRSLTGLKREEIDILRLLSLFDQILSALSAAHARGIIHRDMKPSNILLSVDDDGRELIKLVDFGLAATQTGDLSLDDAPGGLGDEHSDGGRNVIMGTPRYMAPEIFRRAPLDPRVDLYALGVILFEILAGRPPYPGDDPKVVMRGHLKEPIPQLQARDGIDVPTELERVIYRLLAKNPEERYQSASEVREAVQTIINEFSYVPWMQGPKMGGLSGFGNTSAFGNMTGSGFLSGFGGQTIPPSAMSGGSTSRPGSMGASAPAPLVGRATERRAIEAQIRAAIANGTGGIVAIEGEAGIGKSRLIEWVRVRVEESGVMRTASGAYSRQTGGFDGIRSVLDELLGTGEVTYDQIEPVIAAKLSRWDFTADEIETCVQLLRPGGDVSLFQTTGSEERRLSRQERVFAVVERVLRQVAADRPLLVLLENLHTGGETTFAFLEHLAVGLHLNPAPVLIVATLRSEDVDAVPELRDALKRLSRFGTDVVRVRLELLEPDESAALVQKLLTISAELAERVAARSGGNPLHLVQLLRYLQESGKLHFAAGQWELQEGVDLESEIPDELGDLMRYRADKVVGRYANPNALRAILERAAILGQRFDYRLLRGFLHAEDHSPFAAELDGALEYLVKESILRDAAHSAEDVLEFHHAVMRDVLLHDLDGRRSLRDLHRLAAEVKVGYYGSRAGQHALEIADHYRRARDPHGVYIYTVRAARDAMGSSDLRSAVQLYREAKSLADVEDRLDDAVAQHEGLQEVSTVLRSEEVSLEVAHLELRLGEYEVARDHYRTLLRSSDAAVAAWARWGLGELALKQGEYDEATGWFEVARKEAAALEGTAFADIGPRIDGECLFGLGRIDFLRGDLGAASKQLQAALGQAQRSHHRSLEGGVLRTLADTVWALGDADKAEVYRRRASILAESLHDREALAHSALHAAKHLRQIGQPARAVEEAEAAKAQYEAIGKRHNIADCLLVLGQIACARNEFKNAAQYYREAHRLYEAYDDRRGVTHCKLQLARLALGIKKYKETQTLVRDAMEGYRTMGDRHGVAQCRLLVGRLEHASGRLADAGQTFETVAREMEDLGDRRSVLCANALAAASYEALAQHDPADRLIDGMLDEMRTVRVAEEALATALDSLCELLNARRPEVALELDTVAEETWQLLGRPVRASA